MEQRIWSDPDSPRSTEPQRSEHYEPRQSIMFHPPQIPGGGPPCIWDNAPTQRAGSCYVCILCGSTSACG